MPPTNVVGQSGLAGAGEVRDVDMTGSRALPGEEVHRGGESDLGAVW